MTEQTAAWQNVLAKRSIKWRVSAGWLVVCVLAFRYLIHPIISTYQVMNGGEPLPVMEPMNLTDVMAIIGLPVGGAFADKMSGDDK